MSKVVRPAEWNISWVGEFPMSLDCTYTWAGLVPSRSEVTLSVLLIKSPKEKVNGVRGCLVIFVLSTAHMVMLR